MQSAICNLQICSMLKGIILAGGSGSRLHPLTRAVSKQLMPIYNKPMVYYPLSTLMLAGIREVLVITTPHEQDGFRRLLGDGVGDRPADRATPRSRAPTAWRRRSSSAASSSARDRVALALGDNIFYGAHFSDYLRSAAARETRRDGVRLSGPRSRALRRRRVRRGRPRGQPRREAGAAEVVVRGDRAVLLRQPGASTSPPSSKPSARGELEITDVNRRYLERGAAARREAARAASPGSTPARTNR